MAVLVLNAGSSSLRAAVVDDGLRVVAAAHVRDLGAPGGLGHTRALPGALAELGAAAGDVAAVGHRVVHGGARHAGPAVVDDALLAELDDLTVLAPLHMPANVALMREAARLMPGVPHVACFDTAFFHRLPEVATRLPLPDSAVRGGVRRYGFHGLSYEGVVRAVPQAARGRAVLAHLGSGASMAAVRDGVPVETTMGFTPSGGIMMGTRPGDLDPGVVVHLARGGRGPDELDRILTRESGLLGVSGTTADMRRLLDARAGDRRAALAVEMFCTRARREIGGLAAVLGGLDTLVFTGGVGAGSPQVRAEACAGLAHLGVEIDTTANAREGVVSPHGARVAVVAVAAQEEVVIARHALAAAAAAARAPAPAGG